MFTRKWSVYPTCLVLLITGALNQGCGRNDSGQSRSTESRTGTVSIFYTCDTRGNLKPCECKEGDAGGMARRMTMLEALRQNDHLLVDAGDVAAGGRSWEIQDYALLLQAYDVMGYHVVNLGAREAAIPSETLKSLAENHPYLISANLAAADGRLITEPYRIITLSSGLRIGVLGVVDDRIPSRQLGEGIRILPIEDAVVRHLAQLDKQCDMVVMLALVDDARLQELANVYFELDVLIGGQVVQPMSRPEKINRSLVVTMTDQGKHLGRLDLEVTDGNVTATSSDSAYLGPNVPDAAIMAPLIEMFDKSLKESGRSETKMKPEPGLQTLERIGGE